MHKFFLKIENSKRTKKNVYQIIHILWMTLGILSVYLICQKCLIKFRLNAKLLISNFFMFFFCFSSAWNIFINNAKLCIKKLSIKLDATTRIEWSWNKQKIQINSVVEKYYLAN